GVGVDRPDRRPVRVQRPAPGGPPRDPAVCRARPGGPPACGGDGSTAGAGTGPARVAPGAAQGAGEPAPALDGADGVRRAPRGAAGQQHGGAVGARPGGGAEELLRLGGGRERSVGGDALLAVPDAGVVGAQPAPLADGVLVGVRRGRWPCPLPSRGITPVESVGGATPGLVTGAEIG